MDDSEESNTQEVTIEVVPETVTEIVYLPEDEFTNDSTDEHFVPYEIGTVDTSRFPNSNLVLDESADMVVLFPTCLKEDEQDEPDLLTQEDMSLEEQFDCIKCDFTTTSFDELEKHSQVHAKADTCKHCGEVFQPKSALIRHLSEAHTEYTCNICNIVLLGRRQYIAHTRQHNSDFFCPKCRNNFSSSEELMEHMKEHGPLMLYACNKCDEAFRNTTEISLHLRMVHSNRAKKREKNS